MRRQWDPKLQGNAVGRVYEHLASGFVTERDTSSLILHGSDSQCTDMAITSAGDMLAVSHSTLHHGKSYTVKSIVLSLKDSEDRDVCLLSYQTTSSILQQCKSLDFLSDKTGNTCLLILHYPGTISCTQLDNHSNSRTDLNINGCICTCMWNRTRCFRDRYTFVTGSYDGTVMLRSMDRKLCCLCNSDNSPVLSLGCGYDSSVLFCGLRNGVINAWDLRIDPSRCILTVQECRGGKGVASSVIGVHPLTDNNYFISNAFNSNLALWDIRMQSKLLTCDNHVNSFKFCRAAVDRTESLIAAVGSDYCVRLWSLRNGELLRLIEPQEYCSGQVDYSRLPVICFSEVFGGRYSGPTLLVASEGKLSIFNTMSY